MNTAEALEKLGISILVERVEIRANRSGEEHCVLRDDCEPRPELTELDFRNVLSVDCDLAGACFEASEMGKCDGGLARSRTSNDAHTLPRRNIDRKPFEGRREIWRICHL